MHDTIFSILNISMDNMSKNDACSQLCQTILCQKYLTCGRGVAIPSAARPYIRDSEICTGFHLPPLYIELKGKSIGKKRYL